MKKCITNIITLSYGELRMTLQHDLLTYGSGSMVTYVKY